jgi:hypothetical protein
VDHPARVGVRQRLHHVVQHPHDRADREALPPRDRRAHRLSLDVGHRVPQRSVGLAGGEQRDDVRMLQPRRELDLAPEALAVDAGGEVGREHLHHHRPPERTLLGQVHAAHPPARQLAPEHERRRERRGQRRREGVVRVERRRLDHRLTAPAAG